MLKPKKCPMTFSQTMGPARCLGKHMIRSHSSQHRSDIGVMGPSSSAALRHSTAAVKRNPLISSRCAARQ